MASPNFWNIAHGEGERSKEGGIQVNITEAKARLGIHELWSRFGYAGLPSKSCRCPWREDNNPSFAVTEDGTLWYDFSTGEGGDAVDFYARATGLPNKEACLAFIALAGGSPLPSTPRPPRQTSEEADFEKASRREQWPPFDVPTGEDLATLAALRHVSIEGVQLMAARGLLWFATWKGQPAWVVTDDARKNAQARRMDGLPWEGRMKAQTLPGSEATRPIGARESQQFPIVLSCEGGPDLLAAHHFIAAHGRQADVAAVCQLGASLKIHDASLPIFGGKRVRIFPHADEPGYDAAVRWTEQLVSVRAEVDAVDFEGLAMADGSPVEDLNDATRIAPSQEHELSSLIPA